MENINFYNSISILSILVFGTFFYIFFLFSSKKKNSSFLIDNQFNKPQAFHKTPIATVGGVGIFLSLLIVHYYFFLLKDILFFKYLTFGLLFFLLGFADDLKININPKIRLILMIIFLIILIINNNFYIEKTGIEILDVWIKKSDFFSLIFVSISFLFIINGANLIDGYNGLLGIHALAILTNLFLINYLNGNSDLALFLLFNIFIIINFLVFNFPKGKIFLGDSGAYLLGAIIAISIIKTSIVNNSISPFYFCILLFYLFFEVFFSFLRKLLKEKTSPIRPDTKHLHMLLYKVLYKKNNNLLKSNYSVSIVINLIYVILTIPAILMKDNGMFCKYYSLVFFIVYLFSYKIIRDK